MTVFDTVALEGIDPVVQLGKLEELLTDRPPDEVMADPRSGHVLAVKDEGEQLVVTSTAPLQSALATASQEDLDRVSIPWAATEEFWGQAAPSDLAEALRDLATLARGAAEKDFWLYCWVCV